ncbi:hypothetical protein U1Q18_016652 [Sarracenia purpurea var. burkii]
MATAVDRGGGNGDSDGNIRRGCRHRQGGSGHLPRLLSPLLRRKDGVKDVSMAPKLKSDSTFAGTKARSSGVNEKEGDFESKEEQDLGDVKAKDEEGESSVEAEAAISLAEAESEGSVCDESSSAPNEDKEESEYEEEEESEEDLEGEIGEVDTVPNVGFSQVMDSIDVNVDVGENLSCFRGKG